MPINFNVYVKCIEMHFVIPTDCRYKLSKHRDANLKTMKKGVRPPKDGRIFYVLREANIIKKSNEIRKLTLKTAQQTL
jgi:hypothetical protein